MSPDLPPPQLIYSAPAPAHSRGSLVGIRILALLPHDGGVAQETLDPLAALRDAGATIVVATPTGLPVTLEPVGRVMALVEMPWSPTWQTIRRARRESWLSPVVNLGAQAASPDFSRWLAGFAALVLPGGFGPTYADFVLNKAVQSTVTTTLNQHGLVAIQCHSVLLGALSRDEHGKPLLQGRHVTCWPAVYESLLGAMPFFGPYFMPFGAPVESAVRAAGATVHFQSPFSRNPHVVVDGQLVTSWGPWSGQALGNTLVSLLKAARHTTNAP